MLSAAGEGGEGRHCHPLLLDMQLELEIPRPILMVIQL